MKDPHELSAAYILDPGYSRSERVPVAGRSSLYAEGSGDGQPWLYAPGDLEAYLISEARARAFRIVYGIRHPGDFRPPHRSVYFLTDVVIESNAIPDEWIFMFSGALRLTINDRFVGWWQASDKPREVTMRVGGSLRPGANHIEFLLFGTAEPTCLRPDARCETWIWRCGTDDQLWEPPQTLPFMGHGQFPHQEKLPSFPTTARQLEGDVYDFGLEVIGRLRLDGLEPRLHYVFRPGESKAEALYADRREDEQAEISLDARQQGARLMDEKAFRYVRLEHGHRPAPPPEALHCDVVVHPAAYRGAFACADQLATQIWMHSAYTLRMCMLDVTVDGLKRDRLPWVGDMYLSLLGNAFTFAEHRLCLRTLLAFYHPYAGEVNFSGIFDFTLFWVAAAGNYVLFSGDLRGAAVLYPRAKNVLNSMSRFLSKEGFLRSEHAQWIFVDWTDLPKNGILLIVQSLYILALEGAARLARTVGETAQAQQFNQQAAELRQAADTRFWDQHQNCYADAWVDGKLTANGSRHCNAFATLAGIANRERAALAVQTARSNPSSPAGATPYMRYFENAAYCRAGLTELMLAEVGQYWGGMIKEGATTLWEAYEPTQTGDERYAFYGRPFGKSLCHAWASGPLSLYSSELFGLKPVEPGWKTFTFSPAAVSLAWASVCIPTPAGFIRAEFEGDLSRVEVPAGCTVVDAEGEPLCSAPDDQPVAHAFQRNNARWVLV